MNGSILTNRGAMVALQTMKSINKDLGGVQDMISTGKKVANSKDNAAIWAISSVMESDVSGFKAVSDSLALGQSTVSVARNAAEQVKDSLVEIKDKIISSQEENVDRDKIQEDVDAIRSQIKSIVGASQFNGLNLLKGSEDLEVLSSLDRASNGSTTTSAISVDAKSLDSGTAADSVVGTDVVQAVNTDPTTTVAFTDGADTAVTNDTQTLSTFSTGEETYTFATGTDGSLDEGDSVAFSFTDTTDTLTLTYQATATGSTSTSGEDLSSYLATAYTAYSNSLDSDTGNDDSNFNANTGVYTHAKGTFTVSGTNPENVAVLSLSDNAGTLTVTNNRDNDITFSKTAETDRAQFDAADVTNEAIGTTTSYQLELTGTGEGLQSDDKFTVDLNSTVDGGTNEGQLSLEISGAALTQDQLADTIERVFNAYKSGDFDSTTNTAGAAASDAGITTTTTAGLVTVNGANVQLTYDGAVAGTLTEAAYLDNLNGGDDTSPDTAQDLAFTRTGSGNVTFDNDATGGGTNATYTLNTTFEVGSDATAADFTVTQTTGGTVVEGVTTGSVSAGTFDTTDGYAKIDVDNAATLGDTLSITIAGVNDGDPITYTAGASESAEDVAAAFTANINTALATAGIEDVVASSDSAGVVEIKNFNTTSTRDVSDVGVVNELSGAASAEDTNGDAITSIAAGTQGNVEFAATSITEGDTYSITVGSTTSSYVARDGDDLNDVGRNLEGLIKLNSSDDITVDFTAVDDPDSTNSTLSITNNSSSSLAFTTTVKSGGTAGGGLELLDDIDVTTASKAEGSLDLIEGLIEVAIDAAASYGSSEKRLDNQQDFISKLTDSLQSGIGSLVDANLEETSARLQALQVQQQLGTQALSIANQAPQNILSLFR